MHLKVAIYSRKSIYTGKGESIDNQIEMCKQYIFANINNVSENDITIFEDEGFSAKNMDRPKFQKMLKEIKQKKYDYVVCYRLDRISRNVGDFAILIDNLNALGVSFVCIKEKFDTSSPMGKAMMFIASVFAQLERETLAERVRDNMFMLARTGRWLGGTPPTGFVSEKTERIDVDGKIKTACKLKFDPIEIERVKVIFNKFLEFYSVSGVYKYLMDVNIKSRTGKWYSKIGIKQILENPVYCIADKDAREYFVAQGSDVCFGEENCSNELGLLSYNKRDYKKKHAPRQERSEWIIAIGKHKGIVTGKQWVSIQNIFESNKSSSSKTNTHNNYSLLSGTILCCKCGKRMFARLRKRKGANTLYDYICDSKLQGGTKVCDCQNLNGQQTDSIVCDYLMQYVNDNSNIYKLLEKLKKDLQSKDKINPLDNINIKISKLEFDMDNLINSLTQPNLTQAFIQRVNAKVAKLSVELERLKSEKEGLQNSLNLIYNKEIQLDIISNALTSLKTYFKQLNTQEKRTLIKMLVQKIKWDGHDIHIFIYGE